MGDDDRSDDDDEWKDVDKFAKRTTEQEEEAMLKPLPRGNYQLQVRTT